MRTEVDAPMAVCYLRNLEFRGALLVVRERARERELGKALTNQGYAPGRMLPHEPNNPFPPVFPIGSARVSFSMGDELQKNICRIPDSERPFCSALEFHIDERSPAPRT